MVCDVFPCSLRKGLFPLRFCFPQVETASQQVKRWMSLALPCIWRLCLCCRKNWGRRTASWRSTRPSWRKHFGSSLRPVTSRWGHVLPLTLLPLWPEQVLFWWSVWFAGGSGTGAGTQRRPFGSLYEKRGRGGNLALGVSLPCLQGQRGRFCYRLRAEPTRRSVCQEAIWRGGYKCGFWDKKVWFQIPALLLSYHCVPPFASLLNLRNNVHLENDSGLLCHYEEYIR